MFTYLFFSFILLHTTSQEVPFKPANEFEIVLDYKFRERAAAPSRPDFEVKRPPSGPLPYLVVYLRIINQHKQEQRIRITDSNGKMVINRKATTDTRYKLDMGYTEDIKEQLVPHAYTILFLTDEKELISQIKIIIEPDGTFKVNGESRGKF